MDAKRQSRNPSLCAALAAAASITALFTARLLGFVPCFAAVGFAIASFYRSERLMWAAAGAAGLAVLLLGIGGGGSAPGSSGDQSDIRVAQLVDWGWEADPDFGNQGTIKWHAKIHNASDRPIANAKVDFTSYDKSGRVLTTTSTFVSAIPPGGSRSEEAFADYYGTETKASAVVTSVRFGGED